MDTSIPPFGAPDLSLESVRSLSSGAVAIALIGLLEAVSVALAMFVRRTMRPGLPLNVPNAKVPGRPFMSPILWKLPECPQSLFARIQGSLYFGSVEFLEKEFRRLEKERPDQKHFGLMLDGAVGVDLAGA